MKFSEQEVIESLDFSARTNVASDLESFLRAIAAEPSVSSLKEKLELDSSRVDSLLNVMRTIIDLDFDPEYENPMDRALAAYGWIIANSMCDLEGLVGDLLGNLRNSWWSNKLASRYEEESGDSKLVDSVSLYLSSDSSDSKTAESQD